MLLAQIGPLTGLLEATGAAVGSGMLLGGFWTGLTGVVRGWPRRELDHCVMQLGYLGARRG